MIIPSENAASDNAFKEEVDDWANRGKVASKEHSDIEELQRDFTADEIR